MREQLAPAEGEAKRQEMWPRYVGIILPAFVNYGFLLANDDRPYWGVLAASLVLLVGCMAWLAARRDWRGVLWIAVLYVPLNAWPIVLNIIGPLGD